MKGTTKYSNAKQIKFPINPCKDWSKQTNDSFLLRSQHSLKISPHKYVPIKFPFNFPRKLQKILLPI